MFKEKEVLKLKDGNVTFVSDESDFKYLIDKYMGYEASELFTKIINKKEKKYGTNN